MHNRRVKLRKTETKVQTGVLKIHLHSNGGQLRKRGLLKGVLKLERVKEIVSISGLSDWQTVKPNKYHEWIKQRNDAFTEFYPLGTKEAKAGKTDDAIFTLYSLGWATNRDAYIYNTISCIYFSF